jgi:outer membrane receptor protein involved in Fe transport
MNEQRGHSALKLASAVALILAAASAGAQDTASLGEVVVTAQKRAENVRNVPASVSVVGQEQLENFHVTQLSDVAGYVPGLQVTSNGTPGQQFISLRGIAPISPGANVGTYVDETPLGSSSIFQREVQFQLDLLPYDVERLEVLRGPQGTLYGAGSMGGLLKYVTRAPNLSDYEFRAGGGISDVEGADDLGSILRVSANLPLVEGRFALRASYALNDNPGYIDNDQQDIEDINDGDQESARLAMLWQLNDAISLQLTGMMQKIDFDNNASVALDPATFEPLDTEFGNVLTFDEPFEKEIDYYAATVTWDFGAAEFVSATGYSDVSTDQRQDATFAIGGVPVGLGAPAGISFFDLGLDLKRITQEFRLTSATDSDFQWQVGAFYSEEDAHNSQLIRLLTADGAPYPDILFDHDGDPGTPGILVDVDPVAELTLPTDYTELAFFGNASYRFTDRFELGAGIRYASNDQDFWQIVTDGILIPIGVTRGTSDEDVFTWMLTPKWQLNEDSMLYLRVATGYQPGGPNVALPGVPPTVDSSSLTNYELGLKSSLANDRVQLDVALFYIDWDDIQITDNDGVTSWLINGGTAESQGVEIATMFDATEQLKLGFNATYTDATVTNDVASLGGVAGDRLPYVPELSLSATADYFFPLGSDWEGRVGGGYRWLDDRSTGLESNAGAFELDSYGVVDLNADAGNANWTFRAYVKNVADERNYSNIGTGIGGTTPHLGATPIQPRTYGLEVDYRF